jgi:hypothetical protein
VSISKISKSTVDVELTHESQVLEEDFRLRPFIVSIDQLFIRRNPLQMNTSNLMAKNELHGQSTTMNASPDDGKTNNQNNFSPCRRLGSADTSSDHTLEPILSLLCNSTRSRFLPKGLVPGANSWLVKSSELSFSPSDHLR